MIVGGLEDKVRHRFGPRLLFERATIIDHHLGPRTRWEPGLPEIQYVRLDQSADTDGWRGYSLRANKKTVTGFIKRDGRSCKIVGKKPTK